MEPKNIFNKKNAVGTDSTELDLVTDNRKKQFAFVAMILTFISVAIMVLSIVSNDNFGDDYVESFTLMPGDLPYKNESSSITVI